MLREVADSLVGFTSVVADFISPTTDAGVMAQVIGIASLAALVWWMVRSERALVTLVLGVSSVLLALVGIRGLH